jgi:TetR/AcrR family fatty acid metabolism transcriptional regulator
MVQKTKKAAALASEEGRRRAILRAAVDVFAKKGYHGCRIADVAKEAKVAYGLVYHYFHNKEELLQSVFDLAWGGFVSRMREAAGADAPLHEQIHRICEVAFEAYHVDPRGVRVIILEIARSPAGSQVNRESIFAELMALAEQMFTRAQARGELRADLSPSLCAALLIGALEMSLTALVAGRIPKGDPSPLTSARQQLGDTLLRGFLTPAASVGAWGVPMKRGQARSGRA